MTSVVTLVVTLTFLFFGCVRIVKIHVPSKIIIDDSLMRLTSAGQTVHMKYPAFFFSLKKKVKMASAAVVLVTVRF